MLSHFSHVWHFMTLWTVALQAPLCMGFSRQEYWSGLPFPSPGDFPHPGIEPGSPALQADALPEAMKILNVNAVKICLNPTTSPPFASLPEWPLWLPCFYSQAPWSLGTGVLDEPFYKRNHNGPKYCKQGAFIQRAKVGGSSRGLRVELWLESHVEASRM